MWQCLWRHLVANYGTNRNQPIHSSDFTWWPNLEQKLTMSTWHIWFKETLPMLGGEKTPKAQNSNLPIQERRHTVCSKFNGGILTRATTHQLGIRILSLAVSLSDCLAVSSATTTVGINVDQALRLRQLGRILPTVEWIFICPNSTFSVTPGMWHWRYDYWHGSWCKITLSKITPLP